MEANLNSSISKIQDGIEGIKSKFIILTSRGALFSLELLFNCRIGACQKKRNLSCCPTLVLSSIIRDRSLFERDLLDHQ